MDLTIELSIRPDITRLDTSCFPPLLMSSSKFPRLAAEPPLSERLRAPLIASCIPEDNCSDRL
jgi:hypothetical protein